MRMEMIRATRTAEQAGAYYIRIQAMARKHRIPLDVEFDEHDTPEAEIKVKAVLVHLDCSIQSLSEE